MIRVFLFAGTFLSYAMDASEELDLLVIRGVIVEGAQLKRSTGEIIRYVTFQVEIIITEL